jgi:hypothetical protein
MDHFQKERIINYISWGHIIYESDNLILYPLTIQEKSISSFVYEKEYNNAINSGIMKEEELLCYLIENEEWSIENENKINQIKSDIRKIIRGLLDLIFQKNKLNVAKLMLRKAEKCLIELITNKNSLLINSVESYASLKQQRFIISKITHKEDGSLFWKDNEEFNNFTDLELVNKLTNIFFVESRVSTSVTRELARTQPWRNIWSASKNCGNLFNKSLLESTDNQLELISWSQIYDMAYESYERPSNDIIEDDDLLDSWFMRQSEKIEERCKKDGVDNLVKNKRSGKQEVFIFADKNGAKDVYGLNDGLNRLKIQAKQKMIDSKGNVKDQNLPDNQMEMREQLANQLREKMGNIRRGK